LEYQNAIALVAEEMFEQPLFQLVSFWKSVQDLKNAVTTYQN